MRPMPNKKIATFNIETPFDDVTGIILAGGQGKRMGGIDKGLQLFQNQPLIVPILEALRHQVHTILISANRNISDYQKYGYPVYSDTIAHYPGPLAGFLTGLYHCKTQYLLTVPCDTPFIPQDLTRRLKTALEKADADIAIAACQKDNYQQIQSVFTLMKNHLAHNLFNFLEKGGRKIDQWFANLKHIIVHFDQTDAFININTLEELANYQQLPSSSKTMSTAQKKPDFLSVKDAQSRILASLPAMNRIREQVNLFEAADRILAEDIVSPISVPEFDSAAMDGFALNASLLDCSKNLTLKIVGHAYAGHPYTSAVKPGECVLIMTGAVVPPDCDTVIQQENIQYIDDDHIAISANTLTIGDNIREKGENLKAGALVLSQGTRLNAPHLGLLASIGMKEIAVFKPISVAVLSTGDELRSLEEPLTPGMIYDTNRIILITLLKKIGCKIIDLGIIPDNSDQLENALKQAAIQADVIITSGGVSVGKADYTKQVMTKLGDIDFWSVKMRPGRPFAFGKIKTQQHEALLFGLPGNPIATMIAFSFFVKNALLQLMGESIKPFHQITAIAASNLKKKMGRTEFQRGITYYQDHQLMVDITGNQGSGIIQSMTKANCIIWLTENQQNIQKGDSVQIIPLDTLF